MNSTELRSGVQGILPLIAQIHQPTDWRQKSYN